MDSLNYHHLYYFWVAARADSLADAAERLHLTQPTVSIQLAQLSRQLGVALFEKEGRRLRLTDAGRTVLRYADEIFALGQQLGNTLKGLPGDRPLRFTVGVHDAVPKLIVYRLLQPAFDAVPNLHLVCLEGAHAELTARLAAHEVDLVLSDLPALGNPNVRLYSHLLGSCGVSFYATPTQAKKYQRNFPESLANAPLLFPPAGTTLRRQLDQWFDDQGIVVSIKAEFADSALLKVFGQEGLGLFPAPAVLQEQICQQYHVRVVGTIEDIQERYYALSAERRVKHPAVLAITGAARDELFA